MEGLAAGTGGINVGNACCDLVPGQCFAVEFARVGDPFFGDLAILVSRRQNVGLASDLFAAFGRVKAPHSRIVNATARF